MALLSDLVNKTLLAEVFFSTLLDIFHFGPICTAEPRSAVQFKSNLYHGKHQLPFPHLTSYKLLEKLAENPSGDFWKAEKEGKKKQSETNFQHDKPRL